MRTLVFQKKLSWINYAVSAIVLHMYTSMHWSNWSAITYKKESTIVETTCQKKPKTTTKSQKTNKQTNKKTNKQTNKKNPKQTKNKTNFYKQPTQ